MRTLITSFALAAALFVAPATALAGPELATQLAELHDARVDQVAVTRALALNEQVATSELEQLAQHDDWRVRLQAGAALSWRQSPEIAEVVLLAQAEPTRAGLPRFVEREFRSKAAAPVMLQRYLQPGADEWTRLAIAEMLPRTEGDWDEAVAGSWQDEPSAAVRTVLIESIRHGEAAVALPVLAQAVQDESAEVRAGAVRAIGWMDEGGQLEAQLTQALSDSDEEVRAFAARSLGWRGLSGAWNDLVRTLDDADPIVRLNTLRALERIDAARAAAEPKVKAAQQDNDRKVSRAATQIVGG